MNANTIAAARESASVEGTAGATFNTGGGEVTGFGPATTLPTIGVSIAIAFTGVAPPAKPDSEVITPATCVKPGESWFATGKVSANVPLASRTKVCLPEGSMRPSWYGKKWTLVGALAPAGAVSVTTTF